MLATRALLLTDLVDSTALAEGLGTEGAADWWTWHDRMARSLLPLHRGREIDKSDGLLLLFDAVDEAVAFAREYHRALATRGVAARAGVHWCEVFLRDAPAHEIALGAKPLEVDGQGKSAAARVMAIASGGQTLITASARAQLGAGQRTASHGHWRLKGFTDPLELFEVGDEAAPWTPPPDGPKAWRVVRARDLWLPARAVPHQLPAERDGFVGRARDLQGLAQRLADGARLVSVLGIGGSGKTRLVTRYGWSWLGEWSGGVWFCDLSEARDLDSLLSAVASALGAPLVANDPVGQLGHVIANRGACVLLLDNFEQVARLAMETIGAWLDRAADARFVVTTREILGLPGEDALLLAPMSDQDAMALFDVRARAAHQGYQPHPEAVRELVRLLDHLPLAIELAAARVRVMSPGRLLERIGDRFRLLTSSGGRRDRQATLRATLDWSWHLLSDTERSALAQLSVFEGGFTLEAAEAVLDLGDAWAVDAVQALVDKSLVRRVSDGRLDLLVTVQEYAIERLHELGGTADAQRRHGIAFAKLPSADPDGTAVAALAPEIDNLVAACRRASTRGDLAVAAGALDSARVVLLRLGPASLMLDLATRVRALPGAPLRYSHLVGVVLLRLGRLTEAGDLLRSIVAQVAGNDPLTEGKALRQLAAVEHARGNQAAAVQHLDAALALARQCGSTSDEAEALTDRGVQAYQGGRLADARASILAAVPLAAANRGLQCRIAANLAIVSVASKHYDEAERGFQEALVLARALSDRRLEAHNSANLGALLSDVGRLEECEALYHHTLSLCRAMGDRRLEGGIQANLATLAYERGAWADAEARYRTAIAIAREMDDRWFLGMRLTNLGKVLHATHRYAEALALHDEAAGNPDAGGGRVLYNRAKTLAAVGRLDEARADLERVQQTSRDKHNDVELFDAVRSLLAEVLAQLGHVPEATAVRAQ